MSIEFFKKLYSDSGEISFGRWGASLVIFASILWISYLVYKLVQYSDLLHLSVFVGSCGAFACTIYGIAKFNETKQKDNEAKNAQTPGPPAP